MTLRSSPLVLREQLLLTLKIEKINLKQWTNNESLCDSVFCVVRANTYMNLSDCIKECFCLWLNSFCTGCSLSGRSLTSPRLIGCLLMTRPLRQEVRCFASLVLCADWCLYIYLVASKVLVTPVNQWLARKHFCCCQKHQCADSNVFYWLKGGLCELLMHSSSTNRACIDQQSLE